MATVNSSKSQNAQIDAYLSEIRKTGTPDPTVRPKWSMTTIIWYYLIGILECPLFTLIEFTYFCLAAYSYYSAKKKYKNIAINDDDDNLDTVSNKKPQKKLESISIIIPCFNESQDIEATMLYIEKHCYNKKNVEIILVDGGSTDEWWLKLRDERLQQLLTIPIRILHYSEHNMTGRGICQVCVF